MRIIGLDIGEKTVGVALSDPLGLTAQPIETIRYSSLHVAWQRIHVLIVKNSVSKIVAGLPLNMNGSEGPQAIKVRGFVFDLQKFLKNRKIKLDVEYVDERLSSTAAERVLLEADVSRAKRKKVIDKLAASFILQGYLDSLGGKTWADE